MKIIKISNNAEIYIFQKIRNYANLNIQNGKTLKSWILAFILNITMYNFIHIIQFLIPIWSWISKMMLENETFFHFSVEIGFLFSWHLKLIDFVLGSLVEVCEFSYKYLVCSFSEFVDCSNRLTKNSSDSLTVSPADIIFLNCEEFSTALSSTNRLELSWKCFDITSHKTAAIFYRTFEFCLAWLRAFW